jgi:hypothetical protein
MFGVDRPKSPLYRQTMASLRSGSVALECALTDTNHRRTTPSAGQARGCFLTPPEPIGPVCATAAWFHLHDPPAWLRSPGRTGAQHTAHLAESPKAILLRTSTATSIRSEPGDPGGDGSTRLLPHEYAKLFVPSPV